MKCSTIEEALKNYNEVTELYLSGEECEKASTSDVTKFINLKSLHFFNQSKEWISFPEGFKKLNLDVLHIKGVRINELIGLKVKNLGISIASIDILPLCKNFPDLEELSLQLGEEFSIPKEIEQLPKLKKLSISKGTLTNVAEEIATLKELKELSLNGLKFEKLPLQFTKIPNIEKLSLIDFSKLTALPLEIKNWTNLKEIFFQDCFKNREKMNFEDELFHEETPIELPSAIAGLKNLEKIKISFCPIKNLNSLAELTKLEEIKIIQANLKDIDALEKLTKLKKLDINCAYKVNSVASLSELINLEYLDIENTKIEDLTPLSKLTKLAYLNVKRCSFDKNKAKLKDALLPLYALESLKEVKASKMTPTEWDERDRNEAFKKRISPEEIIKVLENEKSNLTEIEEVLNAIEDLETVFNVNKNDVDDDTLKIIVLDTAVSTNVDKLSDKTLQKLVSVSFADTGMQDSYEVTIIAVEEIIKRKSIAGQKHVVKAFLNCCEYYDAGHRFYGNTVQDQLIDDLFPQFELEPLVELILTVEDTLLHPEYGDDVCALYPEIFAKMENGSEYEEAIHAHLIAYILDNIDEEIVIEVLDDILEKEISENSKKTIENLKKNISIINTALEGKSIADFEAMLDEVNKSIPLKIFANFELEDAFCELPLQDISYNKLQATFTLLISSKDFISSQVTNEIIKVLFLLDKNKLEDYITSSADENEEIKENFITLFNEKVSKTEENYIDKNIYEEFALNYKYKLQGKSQEDLKRDLAEIKAKKELKEAAIKQKTELKEAFNKSLKSVDNDFFIDKSQEIINSELLNDYSFDMANYTTKLLINSLQHGNFKSAKDIVIHFTEKLLPVVGPSHKQDDVASNAIVLAIMAKDKEVESLVFEKILPKDFKVTDVKNEILAFNLCCFYAFNNDKNNMLTMIKQALNLGKKPQQFKSDSDFSAFWEDQDFIDVLNS